MSLSELWLRRVFDLIEKEAGYNWSIPHTTVFLPGRMTCFKTDIRGRLRKGSARPSLKVLSAAHVHKGKAQVPAEFGSPITAMTVKTQDSFPDHSLKTPDPEGVLSSLTRSLDSPLCSETVLRNQQTLYAARAGGGARRRVREDDVP
eukprot:3257085-Rhodomonas_salina.2